MSLLKRCRVVDTENRRGYGKLLLMAVVVSALIVVGQFAYPLLFPDRSVNGPIAAVDMSRDFITDTCSAVSKYERKVWTVQGIVSHVDGYESVYIDGGTHRSDGQVYCDGVRLFHGGRAWREPVRIELDENIAANFVVGDTIEVTCRFHLLGFGELDYGGKEIQGYDCVVEGQ